MRRMVTTILFSFPTLQCGVIGAVPLCHISMSLPYRLYTPE
jgi:hypothetical protein